MEELDLSIYSDMGLADLLQTIAAEVRRRGEERQRWKRMQRTMGPRPEITGSVEAAVQAVREYKEWRRG